MAQTNYLQPHFDYKCNKCNLIVYSWMKDIEKSFTWKDEVLNSYNVFMAYLQDSSKIFKGG